MFRNYFKIALRNLANNKVYSLINIAGLTIGLTCAMLILLYVKDEVSFDRFQQKSQQLFRVVYKYNNHGEEQRFVSTSLLQGPKFAQNIPGIKSFTRVQEGLVDFKNDAAVENKPVLFVDANFLNTFTFPVIAGNSNTCLTSRQSVVLTKDEAIKQVGTTEAVGKIMMVSDKGVFVPYEGWC
jgi:putative ABC transport system permease protein